MEQVLPILSLLLISTVAAQNCSFLFDDVSYSRHTILTIKGLPINLAFNTRTKDLLFTLIDLETLYNDNRQTKMEQYMLRNGEPIKIDNVKGQAAAVDEKNNKTYIATDRGIAVLNERNRASVVTMKDKDIVQLFKPADRDVLYATTYPDNDIYIIDLVQNKNIKVDNVPCAFYMAVDNKENIYYECKSKYLNVLLKGFQKPIEFVGLPKNSGRAIAIDKDFRVVLATNDGLYHLRPDNMIPVKLMELDFTPAGIAFDESMFYMSKNDVIYKYSTEGCEKEDTTE